MITVSRLALDHFRSWTNCVLDFKPGVNILEGPNGLGKTNIVEALEVLSTGSSHRASTSQPLVEQGFPAAAIRANIEELSEDFENNTETIDDRTTTFELAIRVRGANRARVDGGPSLYMRDIVGRVPLVAFTPDDQRLVWGDPAVRRSFIDQAASVLVRGYTDLLQRFTHIAKQRAALLKQIGAQEGVSVSEEARQMRMNGLEVWTAQFIETGLELTRQRMAVIGMLNEYFGTIVQELSDVDQTATLVYEPSFDELYLTQGAEAGEQGGPERVKAAISEHFQRIYTGEVARGVNLIGPQRDDVSIELNGMPAREYSSNGESWTLALALKMALYRLLERKAGERPIVVLDDVFAQLDPSRRAKIMDFALRQDQVIITVAAAGDVPELPGDAHAHVIDVAALKLQGSGGEGTAFMPEPLSADDPFAGQLAAVQASRRTAGMHAGSDGKHKVEQSADQSAEQVSGEREIGLTKHESAHA